MANEMFDEAISFNTDWGGDESTGNLPVSGKRIQEFIKNELKGKAGVFYNDTVNGQVLVFNNTEDRDAYLEDRNLQHLIIGKILVAASELKDNNISVELLSPYYLSALPNQKGLYIEFVFSITNKQGNPTGEDVIAEYTFRWNSVVKTITQKCIAGQRVRFAIDDYVGNSGITNVTVKITGVNTGVETSLGVVCNKIDLNLVDTFKVGNSYDLIQNPTAVAEVQYTLSGAGLKTIEWYIDGTKLAFDKDNDEVTEQSTTRTKYISLQELSEGVHYLQYRAYILVNGEKFYSQTVYREFAVYKAENNNKVMLMIGAELNSGTIINSSNSLVLNDITQYLPYTIKLGAFSPSNEASIPVGIYLGNELQTSLNMTNDVQVEYTFVPKNITANTITLNHSTNIRDIAIAIQKTSTSLSEINSNLSLSLVAQGKSNSSADKEVWKYNDIKTTFTDFKWTDKCGWDNGTLVISDGANIEISDTPLAGDVTNTGKTLEFELSTSNVINDDAVICDLRNGNTGLLITASEASITSASGSKVSVKYKAEENIRITFVINPRTGVTNKQLVFIYVNGILSGAANYAANDNFRVNDTLKFVSSTEVSIKLKELRFYNTALTSDQVLNNYTLYRDDVAEMLKIYDRNNIFVEGSSEFSTDILSSQLPIMIFTGNIPALEATTDKNLQIEVDVEYTNIQDPTRSFEMRKAALRPQGTSSMSYPKKNFRLYTKKLADTILYDSEGNVVENKLYSFKTNAQPVDCWCLKADYAESSGTHNTGIARLWNNALKNTQINKEYKLRTEAQKAAIDGNYQYDVRTTIDGFPILVFYRLNVNSPLVFIGKYNFNNDKSTESVFGFRDIPNFDSSKVECWEVLNNGHHLALFNDVTNWDTEWSDAFEARYPDGSTNTTALKTFAEWLTSVDQTGFATQKWNHLDVYKVAAYYIYLMRFGAVDQVVKNAMFTTEDGVHWFYINYDNDTINGLRNDGLLIYPPTIDRQSKDTTVEGVYAYAGHDSSLWNKLEADEEFMQIVSEVDNALYSAGLTYNNVINTFDNEQSDKWCERIYNQDSQYKYIGPFNNNGINNLFMLQGSRKSHRRYWLSRRFNWIDSKFVSGAYKDNVVEFKLAGAPIGLNFTIKAGFDMNYGYGVNNVPIQYGVPLKKEESHTFTTQAVLNVGDPLRVYAAPNIKSLELEDFMPYLTQTSFAGAFSNELGTKLEKLILGVTDESIEPSNSALNELSGLSSLTALKVLNIRRFTNLRSLDLSKNVNIKEVYAGNSGLTSITLPENAKIDVLELPDSMVFLTLRNLSEITFDNLQIDNYGWHITDIVIANCPNFDSKQFIDSWLEHKLTIDADCSLTLEGIDWKLVNVDYLLRFGNFRSINFKGKVQLDPVGTTDKPAVTVEQLLELKRIFGNNCFSKTSQFYIEAPAGEYIIGPDSINGGETAIYEGLYIGEREATEYSYSIVESNSKISINQNTGALSVDESLAADTTITVQCDVYYESAKITTITKEVNVIAIIYPNSTNSSITGDAEINGRGSYNYALQVDDTVNGNYTVQWKLEGFDESLGISISPNNESCVVNVTKMNVGDNSGTLKAEIYKGSNKIAELTKNITVIGYLMTKESNPEVMAICYVQGWAASPDYMTVAEAEAVTNIGKAFINSNIKHFDEFEKFIGVTKLGASNDDDINTAGGFSGCNFLTKLKFPNSIKYIYPYSMAGIGYGNNTIETEPIYIDELILPATAGIISSNAFYGAFIKNLKINHQTNRYWTILESAFFQSRIKNVDAYFYNNNNIPRQCFYENEVLETVNILNDNKVNIGENAFYNSGLKSIDFNKINSISSAAFYNTKLTEIKSTNTLSFDNGEQYFSNIKTLKNINLNYVTNSDKSGNGSVQNIFKDCDNLENVIINNFSDSISKEMFLGCKRLKSIQINNISSNNGFKDRFLSGCISLTNIYINKSNLLLGNYVFGNSSTYINETDKFDSSLNNFCYAGLAITETKTLHVPADATGYDTGDWVDVLLNPEKCGFVLVRDL